MLNAPLLAAKDLDLGEYIRSGDTVVCGQVNAEPLTLTRKLVEFCASTGLDVRCFLGTLFTDTFDTAPSTMRFQSYGAIGRAAMLADRGLLDVLPVRYSELAAMFMARTIAADVVLIQVAVAEDGSVSLGLANDYLLNAARRARVVMAEVNDRVPWTYGTSWPDDLRVSAWVRAEAPPFELSTPPPDPVSRAIGELVSGIVPDGATLQVGVGALPDAMLGALHNHRHLGLHSGVLGDAGIALIKSGAIDNSQKGFDAGISVTNTVCGSADSFAFTHRNRAIEVRHSDVTHSGEYIRKLNCFQAINSALEVDLAGRVNSERLHNRLRGGIGGLKDFTQAAPRSRGGRSITVLPATAAGGKTSRIVVSLNGPATLGQEDADTIITEYGIAELRGIAIEERARRMIAIAAPQFREALRRAANR